MTAATQTRTPQRRLRITTDAVLTTCGLSAATASAAFASYMLAFGPANLGPRSTGQFGVFAQFDRRPRFAAVQDADRARSDGRAAPERAQRNETLEAADLDYTPTGSVSASTTSPRAKVDAVPLGPQLSDFTLRDVINGTAVVESRNRLSVVKPGSVLAGAGEVRAIQHDGTDWVVLTDRGAIMRQPKAPTRR